MRRLASLTTMLIVLLPGLLVAQEDAETGATSEPCILMIIAHKGFRDEEYEVPRSIFEESGLKVAVASSDTTPAKGMLGMEVKPDLLIKDVEVSQYDCLIFVGGVGAKDYWEDDVVHSLATAAVDSEMVLGAICIAPVILAKAGVLKGLKATVFKTRETGRVFKEEGVIYTGEDVTLSGRIVTGRGPEAAEKFAKKILTLVTEGSEPSRKEE